MRGKVISGKVMNDMCNYEKEININHFFKTKKVLVGYFLKTGEKKVVREPHFHMFFFIL